MRVTNLPHILRGAGLPVVVHAGADTRGQGELISVEALFVHHTGSASMPGAVNVVRDGRAGLRGLLSQLAVDPAGRWHYLGSRQAWHAGTGGPLPGIPANGANSRSIGIEGVSNGGFWTPEQRWSYPRGVAALADAFRLSTDRIVWRHQDWAPGRKTDAGVWTTATFRRDVDWHRADLRAGGDDDMNGEQDRMLREVHQQLFGPWDNPGPPAGPGHGWPVEMIAQTHAEVTKWLPSRDEPGEDRKEDRLLGQAASAAGRALRAERYLIAVDKRMEALEANVAAIRAALEPPKA